MRVLAVFMAVATAAAAQDVQVGARAKGMGGSYTAFGDDATAIWYNPAGLATQRSKIAVTYQSYVTYEFNNGAGGLPGDPQATLQEPGFVPSFAGIVLALGDEKIRHAFSFAYISPMNMSMTWNNGGVAVHTKQTISRMRVGYGGDIKLSDKGTGFLPHIALGGAVDWGSTQFEQIMAGATTKDQESDFGYGAGVLLTVFDDGAGLSVDVGVSGNSQLDFQYNVNENTTPVFDWPAMYAIGIAIYVKQLKVTADLQVVNWEDAVGGSTVAGVDDFENAVNLGLGAEYAIAATDQLTILPRAGLRIYDAPWDDEDPLTVGIGNNRLSIDTNEESFVLFSLGVGVYFTTKEGLKRGFDLAVTFGGDKITIAVSYTHDF
jgi:hypothetical protein